MNEEQTEIQTPNFEGEEMKMPENTDAPPTTKEGASSTINSNGIILIILSLLLILILGGMYYWFSTLNTLSDIQPTPPHVERPTAEENNEPESTTAEAQTEAMQVTSTSDEIQAITADLEGTDLDSLDAEMAAIDAEIEAALSET